MPGKHLTYQHMISLEIDAFLLDREISGRSLNTLTFYRNELTLFSRLCASQGVDTIEGITPNVIRSCVKALQPRRNKGGLHAFGRSIRAFLNWFEQEDEIKGWDNPIHKVKKIGEQNREALPGISQDEIKKLLSVLGKKRMDIRDRAMIYFMYDTGIRVSEMCALNIEDVNLKTGDVYIKNGKGGISGTAFISTVGKRELLKYYRHRSPQSSTEPLFLSNTRRRITRRGVDTMLDAICKRAGIEKKSAHDFRRAFCKATLQRTNVATTARLMRHKDIYLVMRYDHQRVEDLREAHDISSPANNL